MFLIPNYEFPENIIYKEQVIGPFCKLNNINFSNYKKKLIFIFSIFIEVCLSLL